MFRHKAWMSSIAYYAGVLALVYAVNEHGLGLWLGWALLLYFFGTLTISVGYHRLFCHGAFKTNQFWHWAFALYGVLFMYSSPIQWGATHATHHRFSDTDRDPHPAPMRLDAFLRKGYRNVPMLTMRAKRLMRQDLHKIVDNYYVAIYLLLVLPIALIAPEFFLYSYLPALGIAHFVGACHNTFSHAGGKPRDLWFMEYLLPSAGEWNHGHHHRHVSNWQFGRGWYRLDTGALLIKAIRQ